MSERSKGDVSSRVNKANVNRVLQNPLLSASVTGLCYEDFPNKPLLLPAAPPVVHAPPPQPTNALIAGILKREPKSLVTVGQPSTIDDSETLDEINLNASSSDDSTAANTSINPYQGEADANANPLLEPPLAADSLLSQAASSFGALPSVASNVFSTFSKRIYASTRDSDEPASTQPQLDIQPNYIQQASQAPPAVAPPALFYAAPPTVLGEAAPEPPKFYAPAELSSLAAGTLPLPPTSAGSNTYRISARKKLYAPIPGLSEHHSQPVAAIAPFQTTPYPTQPAVAAFEPPAPPIQEERKSVGGLFSLTNLVPTGVLQNISGLVQSAKGRTNEPPPPVSHNTPNPVNTGEYFDISSVSGAAPLQPTNFFPSATAVPPAAPSYFTPANTQPAVGGFFKPPVVAETPPPAIGGYFTPATAPQLPPTAWPPVSAQPPPESLAVTQPPPVNQPVTVGHPSAVVQPPQFESTPALCPPPSAAAPPPATGPTQASYRLQKGTRLYKSPLTAQETARSTVTAAPAAIFNPFEGAQPAEIALFAPTALTVSAAPSIPELSHERPKPPTASLFTPQDEHHQAASAQEAIPPSAVLFEPTSSNQEAPLFPSLAADAPQADPLYPLAEVSSHFTAQVQIAEPSSSSILSQEVVAPSIAALLPTPVPEIPLFPSSQSLPFYPPAAAASLFNPQLVPDSAAQQTGSELESGQEIDLFALTPAIIPAEAVQGLSLYPPGTATALFTPQDAQEPHTTASIQEPGQEVPPVAALPTSSVEEVSQGLALYPPACTVSSAFGTEVNQGTPLFVPVPTAFNAESNQGFQLYPPKPTETADLSLSPNTLKLASPEATGETKQPISNLFAPLTTDETVLEGSIPAVVPASTAQFPQFATGTSTSDLFAPAQPNNEPPELPQVALTTQTTTTFFNPFAQTITTPVPQDLLPPPIGFVAPITQADPNILFEAQTIEPVLPETEVVAAAPAPPPAAHTWQVATGHSQANQFRKPNEATETPPAATSALQSFFTPAESSSGFRFFEAPKELAEQLPQFPELPPQNSVASPALAQEPSVSDEATPLTTHSLGFEQLISDSTQPNTIGNICQNSSVNSFSGYFGGSEEATVPAAHPPPQPEAQPLTDFNSANFFDHFATGGQGQEDQRIQNFFNNPPLQDQPAAPGELKYDIVHSGLPTKRFEERSQTSVSNLVEPPSSACSEFSTAPPANANPVGAQQPDRQAEYFLQLHQGELPEEILQQLRMANDKGKAILPSPEPVTYTPALPHWFYKRIVDAKVVWTPFSHYDSALLETSLNSEDADSSSIVAVEGGRYDVNIKERTKTPVFWEGKAIEVRRCSWFYKAADGKYVPYAETTAASLEAEYKRSTETNEWRKKIPLGNGEQVTMHGPTVIVHFMPPDNGDTWGASVQSSTRPLVVKRDLKDFKIQQGESQRVDHLLFMVHGIGSACDLKMRNVEEVVDDFRNIAQQLVQSHYKNSTDMGLVGRVEVLPIEWHGHLHSEELGIDEKLKSITLESIPRLRNFTNDTLLDVLFYTSPKYCQKIMNTVADALNEVYLKYRMRHPEFNGGVSLAGHSLGSLILFDLLCHQEPLKESEEENKENPDQLPQKQCAVIKTVQLPNNDEMLPKQVSYAMGLGPAGTGQPVINYTQLIFHPKKFFALGSPIGMFVTIRGIDKLGLDFRLPTCAGFYNIFHPFDPVAYRIEALVNPDMKGIRPVLIPHHKGRKRMHLELKETMTRVGADIKQRFMDTFKTTLDSVNFLTTVTKVKKEAEESLEKEVNVSSSQVFQKQTEDQDDLSAATTSTHARNRTDSESTTSDPEFIELDFPLGKLNDSKRVDYVLQEAPLEFINEYIFALSSHVCYWGSDDTILFVMKEIYAGLGISTDSQVPQQSMIIERPSSRNNSISQSLLPM